ncbi:hypothetical protein ACFVY4_16155 [Streptomyces sp. NPDC058299]|uniref:hypothetical protein n=1 Tax=Streptomyces sp. NPDC058299 TaxID=3346435 RepID=UPI0036E678FB
MTRMVNARQKHSADLPHGFDAWLLDCVPAVDCDVCAANWRQLVVRKQAGDITRAARHATEIRDHPSGVHDRPSPPHGLPPAQGGGGRTRPRQRSRKVHRW